MGKSIEFMPVEKAPSLESVFNEYFALKLEELASTKDQTDMAIRLADDFIKDGLPKLSKQNQIALFGREVLSKNLGEDDEIYGKIIILAEKYVGNISSLADEKLQRMVKGAQELEEAELERYHGKPKPFFYAGRMTNGDTWKNEGKNPLDN